MTPRRIILDCDPGVDDALAILLAFATPEAVTVEAITTVIGNVMLDKTTANALRIRDLAGRSDIPIYAGCPRPIMAPIERKQSVHGGDGLGDIDLPAPASAIEAEHAVDAIIRIVRNNPGQITLCPIGPMTNIALALIKAPDIAKLIPEIVFMGGAAFRPGNSTPAAEFNFMIDPHAAQIMLTAGIPLTMFGLDVTAQALITKRWMDTVEAASGKVGRAAIAMLRAYGFGDPCLHDPCVIAHLIEPSLFDGVDAWVEVETTAPLTRGQSVAAVAPRHRPGHEPNCRVITSLDSPRLFDLLREKLISLG
ncbi:nucleoside hydrolase [Acidisoma cellulosilytica]|uniref:Nucleoside hydrolase n=1 Tax=Acidisoma cellulosilyticum TaxID=2802395 RepID=A0A963Z769_9PROT|nr:nucleoside hydrolase [Acidisoma cellulosilyticum]MCB8883843.1 nucleoside hydrolase [Acidisoma cellulosilyticum]